MGMIVPLMAGKVNKGGVWVLIVMLWGRVDAATRLTVTCDGT